MNVYTEIQVDGYERVVKCVNDTVGLVAFISVHNVELGPSLGGCRLWNYGCHENALMDALRLSKAMTYKSCLAKIGRGGGKSVISIVDGQQKNTDLLEAMGEFVEHLNGMYIIAEDVNVGFDDMPSMRKKTKHVASAIAGDPSPVTAEGVFRGIQGSWAYLTGSLSLAGVRVGIQGAGEVGSSLIGKLFDSEASIVMCDINPDHIQKVLEAFPTVDVVHKDELILQDLDIFAPCAMGGSINHLSVDRLQARLVAGCANNQLSSKLMGRRLSERGILYAPDYVINAGGVMQICGEVGDKFDQVQVELALNTIPETLVEIYHRSTRDQTPTNIVADKMVEEILEL